MHADRQTDRELESARDNVGRDGERSEMGWQEDRHTDKQTEW